MKPVAMGAVAIPAALLLASCSLPGGQTIPTKFEPYVHKAAKTCDQLKPELLASQIAAESGWDVDAISRRNAQGIAQFIPSTWEAWGEDTDGNGLASPFDPKDAIAAQGRLMCHLIKQAEDSELPQNTIRLALAAYNAGWGAVEEHGGIPPYPETQSYVAKVTERAPDYHKATQRDRS